MRYYDANKTQLIGIGKFWGGIFINAEKIGSIHRKSCGEWLFTLLLASEASRVDCWAGPIESSS